MPLKRVSDNPTATDVILFDILTPGYDGCLADPYQINRVTVYFIERNFADGNPLLYEKTKINPTLDTAATTAEALACTAPSAANILAAQTARSQANATITTLDVYFTDTVPVFTLGTDAFPAWLTTDQDDSQLYHALNTFGTGLNGQPILIDPTTMMESPIVGHFLLQWDSKGTAREGDYFICWTWTPAPAGATLTAHIPFTIEGNTEVTQSIPTHFTVPDKYITLLERYLPEMFKLVLCPGDLTPDVLEKLHQSVAMGYTSVENLANQIIDLLDANSIHDVLIPYLSNLFNLKLKSGDPTLWRRQVKEAIPLFKRKGTKGGLKDALSASGIKLFALTSLYQFISPYTWNDFFISVEGENTFQTTYTPTNLAPTNGTVNFMVTFKRGGADTVYGNGTISWTIDSTGVPFVTFTGVALEPNDQLLIMYEVHTPTGSPQQTLETYTQSLYLADQRSENINGTLIYPRKNWNVRVIEETDPLFPLLCSSTTTFEEDIVFGHVRTEFPYSENIYNMDEYNGSTRCSTDACNIDKDFLDACSCCLSSKFNIDVEIEELCDDRIAECQDVISEFVPFHARLHMLGISGVVEDFILPPEESVETLITYKVEENVISGNANAYFNRARGTGYGTINGALIVGGDPSDPIYQNDVRRNMLADSTVIYATIPGVAYNVGVYLFSPGIRLDQLGISPNNLLEIYGSSANNGSYVVSNPEHYTVQVQGATEPLDQTLFTFRLSNFIYNQGATVYQDDLFQFSDSTTDLTVVDTGWHVLIPAYSGTPFTVTEVYPNGVLILLDPGRLLPVTLTTAIHYSILNTTSRVIFSGLTFGVLQVSRRGCVSVVDPVIENVRNILKINDYALLLGTQYRISGFVTGDTEMFYIDAYSNGDNAGLGLTVYRRLLDNQVGNFDYRGLMLNSLSDFEIGLQIQDGSGEPVDINERVESTLPGYPSFKSNFLIMIDQDYYLLSDINASTMTLSGPPNNWGTQGSGGTDVMFSVIQFSNVTTNLSGTGPTLNIDGQEFQFIDRRGNDVVHMQVNQLSSMPLAALAATALNTVKSGGTEVVTQTEDVSFTIQYKTEDDEPWS